MRFDLGVELIGLNFVKTHLNGKKEIIFRAANEQEAKDIWKLLLDRGVRNRTAGMLIGVCECIIVGSGAAFIYRVVKRRHVLFSQRSVKEVSKPKSKKFKIGFCASDEE